MRKVGKMTLTVLFCFCVVVVCLWLSDKSENEYKGLKL